MVRFCLLGSGSSGNAMFAASHDKRLLIDNGLSFKQLRLRLAQIGHTPEDLDAVFVTHEHGDHCRGLGMLARKYAMPVFMTEGTYSNLPDCVGVIPNINTFVAGDEIQLNGFTVSSFSVSHDAADPVSFTITHSGAKLGIACDMGSPSNLVRTRLALSHGLILESNYCPDMLRRGPYPPMIQQRIRGRYGHMSNADMCSLLSSVMHDALQVVVLVHVSEENNDHGLVRSMAMRALGRLRAEVHVAPQRSPTNLFEIKL